MHSSGAGFAPGCPCSVMPCALPRLCCAADSVPRLHEHLCVSSAAALQRAARVQAWELHRGACKGGLPKGMVFAVFPALCGRQVCEDTYVTDCRIKESVDEKAAGDYVRQWLLI